MRGFLVIGREEVEDVVAWDLFFGFAGLDDGLVAFGAGFAGVGILDADVV